MILPWRERLARMIQKIPRTPKPCLAMLMPSFMLALALSACAPIPFGTPRATPGHPIITSGIFTLPGNVRLPYRLYPAQGQTRAVVLALHGYDDSRDGWAMLATVLNRHGITLVAPDQSGFGATPDRGHWPGTNALVTQAGEMATQLRAQYPNTRLVLMGESMGGAIGLLLAASPHPPPVNAYVLSAPAVWGGAAMSPVDRIAIGLGARIAPGARLTGQSVHIRASDNIAALIAFGEDPLTIHAPRLDDLAGLIRLMGKAQAACAKLRQPSLILYGGHDELVPAAAMRACWRAIPAGAPVMLAFYQPDYHLIERDIERATPDADIIGYILGTNIPSAAPSAATVFLAG
ncbi:MAG: alpha/beta fold hydrolase [Acidocella sp.]|nr:alpha/beta fold hydrolase [Acidocella sp.]